jgi:hypothetical protein
LERSEGMKTLDQSGPETLTFDDEQRNLGYVL